jgi:hypothetical protein
MSDETTAPAPEKKCYFVDEAGDHTLFGSRGKVLVGSEGCYTKQKPLTAAALKEAEGYRSESPR